MTKMAGKEAIMIKPLTKVSQKGKRYIRPPEVLENIEGALAVGIDEIRERLKSFDPKSEGFLKSECLVYLFRRARAELDDPMCNLLATAILSRCEAVLKSKVSKAQDELIEEILSDFALLLVEDNPEKNELDYYECRFNHAFQIRRFEAVRKKKNESKKVETRSVESISCNSDGDVESDSLAWRATHSDNLERSELLEQLPDEIRKAVVLCYEMGFDIESSDPSKTTVATLCGVSGRTIRNWLRRAEDILSQHNDYKERV